MNYEIINADCFTWMLEQPENSFHAIVTDPPYGIEEFKEIQLDKMENGKGGIWRIPPEIGGSKRKPLPRFTVLSNDDIDKITVFFREWGKLAYKILVPGSHVIIASNPYLVAEVIHGLKEAGFEHRGILVRLVRTLKGGNRPKLAEDRFHNVSTIPRSCWEPWAILRKPFEGRTSENLDKWGTGGLRRNPHDTPFLDVIISEKTPKNEKNIASHPTLKPQSLMRRLVWGSLPLGKGKILDPFCGSGSTLAAAESMGLKSVGIEKRHDYYQMALEAIPKLAALKMNIWEINSIKKEYEKKLEEFLVDDS